MAIHQSENLSAALFKPSPAGYAILGVLVITVSLEALALCFV
jgi:hypothetical protein